MASKLFEALASLQSAAAKFLRTNGFQPAKSLDPHVVNGFTCEIDKSCQAVLANTYNCCCFSDITTFDPHQKFQHCMTHKKKCRVRKNFMKSSGKKRNSFQFILSVCFEPGCAAFNMPTFTATSLERCGAKD